MRHYGAPTRILDFTYSLFIAAYFALASSKSRDIDPAEMPVVWAINRTWLTKYLTDHVFARALDSDARRALEESWFEPSDHDLFWRLFVERDAKDDLMKGDSKDTDFAVVLNTYRSNDRILVQQGLFVAATNIKRPLHNLLEDMPGYSENVSRITVSAGAHDILRRLYRAGVNSASLFPGLQGFSESLHSKILTYCETKSVRDPDQEWRTRRLHQNREIEDIEVRVAQLERNAEVSKGGR